MPRGWLGVALTRSPRSSWAARPSSGPLRSRRRPRSARRRPREAQAFRPLVPSRVLDTRMPGQGPALGPGAVRNVQLAGVAGIPANAVAVALNVTVTEPTSSGFVSLFPAGTPWAGNSNLNFTAGQTVPNMVLVGLGAGGQVSILNWLGATHVVVDVTGWFTNGFRPITPTRLLDTRVAGQGPALVSGETRQVPIGGRAGIPNGAVAVALNVTVVGAGTSGFLSVFPAGTGWPGTSTVNFLPGQVVPNMALVGLGPGGRVSVLGSGGPVHVIVDATGWFADGFQPVTPARVADTRTGRCGFRLGQGDRRSIEILGEGGVPVSGAAAAALNVTATNPTSSSYLTVYPKGSARPVASNLNVVRDQTVANMVMTGIGADGAVVVYNNLGTVDVIIDVTGWLQGPTSARALLDCQVLPAPAPRAPPGFNIPPGSFVVGRARPGRSLCRTGRTRLRLAARRGAVRRSPRDRAAAGAAVSGWPSTWSEARASCRAAAARGSGSRRRRELRWPRATATGWSARTWCRASTSHRVRRPARGSNAWGSPGARRGARRRPRVRGRLRRDRPVRGRLPFPGLRVLALGGAADRVAHRAVDGQAFGAGLIEPASHRPSRASGSNSTTSAHGDGARAVGDLGAVEG